MATPRQMATPRHVAAPSQMPTRQVSRLRQTRRAQNGHDPREQEQNERAAEERVRDFLLAGRAAELRAETRIGAVERLRISRLDEAATGGGCDRLQRLGVRRDAPRSEEAA